MARHCSPQQKRKRVKRQVKPLKLTMGELCLARFRNEKYDFHFRNEDGFISDLYSILSSSFRKI